MLFKPILIAFAMLGGAFANPVPETDELDSRADILPNPNPGPIPPRFPVRPIGMKGQKRRTLSLEELTYLGTWDPEKGCDGAAKRSSGRSTTNEGFGALFSSDVQAAAISITSSGFQRIFVGAGHVWNLKNVSAPTAPCTYDQAITFTGIRMATPQEVLFPPGNPLRGNNGFLYLRLPSNVVNIQRQWLQVNKVRIYSSFTDVWADLKGYERTLYRGPAGPF